MCAMHVTSEFIVCKRMQNMMNDPNRYIQVEMNYETLIYNPEKGMFHGLEEDMRRALVNDVVHQRDD